MFSIWIITSLPVSWQTAAADMELAIHEMESQDVQAYILDLRNNPVLFFTYFANRNSCKVPFLTSNFCSIMFFFLLFIGGAGKSRTWRCPNMARWGWDSCEHSWSRWKHVTHKHDRWACHNSWSTCCACKYLTFTYVNFLSTRSHVNRS